MIEKYSEQFNRLPLNIQETLSSLTTIRNSRELEKKYKLPVLEIVLKLAINEIYLSKLSHVLMSEYKLSEIQSRELEKELKEKVLKSVLPYLESLKPPLESVVEKLADQEMKALEEEVNGLRTKMPQPSLTLNEAIERIMGMGLIDLPVGDEVLKTRYRNIIISFLKEVRDEVETRQVLKRPQKIGGMELDESTINKIIKTLKEERTEIIPEVPPKREEKKPDLAEGIAALFEIARGEGLVMAAPEEKAPPAEAVQRFEFGTIRPPVKEPPSLKAREAKEPRLIRPVTLPFETLPPVVEELLPGVDQPQAEKISSTTLEEKAIIEELAPSEPIITVRRPPPSGRPIIEEIKTKPRIYGPADELRSFRLIDWKRLGGGKEAAERIFDKIQLLGEESLTKKAQGVKSWKDSEVHLLYLDIGTEAVDKGKTVEEVICDRQKENQPILTIEDFDAIGELNQKLRF